MYTHYVDVPARYQTPASGLTLCPLELSCWADGLQAEPDEVHVPALARVAHALVRPEG